MTQKSTVGNMPAKFFLQVVERSYLQAGQKDLRGEAST
jgi:hypothetical protein